MLNPQYNEWLEQLAESDYLHLQPRLRLVSLQAGERLYAAGDPIHQLHFPVGALIALSRELSEGVVVDTALIGEEGVVGLRGLIGDASLHDVHVATSGLAYALDMADFVQAWQGSVTLQRQCILAGARILDMMSSEFACSRFHGVEARLAKWILTRCDRSKTTRIQATHQTIADSLGVRREAVTNALRKFGGVRVVRGSLEVLDRATIEARSCECYATLRQAHTPQLSLPLERFHRVHASHGRP